MFYFLIKILIINQLLKHNLMPESSRNVAAWFRTN